jgi:hypothetical protein
MKKAVLGLGMVGLSVLGVACSGGTEGPSPLEVGAQDLAARLEAATGVQWQVGVGAKGAEALVPRAPVRLSPGSADEQAKAFVRAYGKDLHLGSAGVTVEPRAATADGVDYVRLAQTLPGTEIVVFDAVTTMSFDAEGRVEAILPSFSEGTEGLGTTPTLSAAAAQEVAKQVWSKTCEGPVKEVVASEPVLGAATNQGGLRLAYRLQVGGLETDCAAAQFDIDAATGSVLAVSGTRGAEDVAGGVRFARGLDPNDKKKLIVTGALGLNTMVSPSVPIVTCSSYGGLGVALTSSSPGQWDDGKGAAVDGYFYAMESLRFFREGLGRNGLDDRGLGVRIVVHDNSAANDFGRNACFRNTGKGLFLPLGFLGGSVVLPEVHIGDGSADRLPYSAGYDLLAHELGHGIVAYSSKLLYQGESGAIDESFADVVGVSAREWSRLPGQPASLRLGEKYVIGGNGAPCETWKSRANSWTPTMPLACSGVIRERRLRRRTTCVGSMSTRESATRHLPSWSRAENICATASRRRLHGNPRERFGIARFRTFLRKPPTFRRPRLRSTRREGSERTPSSPPRAHGSPWACCPKAVSSEGSRFAKSPSSSARRLRPGAARASKRATLATNRLRTRPTFAATGPSPVESTARVRASAAALFRPRILAQP